MLKIFVPLIMLITGLVSINDASRKELLMRYTPAVSITDDTLKTDPETGLIIDKRLALVKANCTGCHSPKLIQQHRFTREGWVGKIRWMQQYHNLWNLGESEKVILDYLEEYYSPESTGNLRPARRAPLQNIEWYKH
jgi:hypothetical protein